MVDTRSRALRALAALSALMGVVGVAGCELDNPGVPPPRGTISFPAIVAVPPAGAGLSPYFLVGSSNFDVRYNAGSLQSYDIQAIEDAIPTECDPAARRDCETFWDTAGNETLGCVDLDGLCTFPVPDRFLLDEVLTDSQVDGLSFRGDGSRVYLVTRSVSSLTYIDVSPEGELTCQSAPDGLGVVHRCDEGHEVRRGADHTLPVDPVALASASGAEFGLSVNPAAQLIVVAHRNAQLSLFREDDPSRAPELIDVRTDGRFDVISSRFDPFSGSVWLTSAASTTQRASRDILQIGVRQTPRGERLAISGILSLSTPEGPVVNDALDQRDVVFDDTGETAWILMRRPESVLAVDRVRTPFPVGSAVIDAAFSTIGMGPMRMQRVTLMSPSGPRSFLVVTCFDLPSVWILDENADVVSITYGFAGPFELAIDASRQLAYVTDFRESTVYAVDLSPLVASGTGASAEASLRFRLGRPRPPSLFSR